MRNAAAKLQERDARASCARRCPICGARYRASRQNCAHDGASLVDVAIDPLIGETLGKSYRIEEPLGRGGMGELYVATHLRVDRSVAIKVLHAAFADHDLALARFYREARAMARVRSPYVVQVLDALVTSDGRPCLVVELIDGQDLQTRLRGGRLGVSEALEMAEQLCVGLHAAHSVGVIHRDLKPSNIVLDTAGIAKLVDFGVAHLDEDAQLTQTGTVVGTPAYMAPEQVRGSANVDARADVYGLGAVLYRALTGHAPYEGRIATAVLSQVLESAPPTPRSIAPDLPADVESWLMRAMSRDPDTRFESACEMGDAARRIRLRHTRVAPWSEGTRARVVGVSLAAATLATLAFAHDLSDLPSWAPPLFGLVSGAALARRGWRSASPGPWSFRIFWALAAFLAGVGALHLAGAPQTWPALPLALVAWHVTRRSSRRPAATL